MKTIIFDFDGTIVLLPQKTGEKPIPLTNKQTLRTLAKKYNLALVTGSPKQEVLSILLSFGWLKFFRKDLIITKDDTKYEKRTGQPFGLVLKKIKGPVVIIGDSSSDKSGSEASNIPIIMVKKSLNILEQRKNLKLALQSVFRII